MMIHSFLISHFFANQVGILGVDLNKINLYDNKNFDKDYPETIIHVRHLDQYNKFETCKALISKQLMPVAWPRTRWWDWCLSEDEKKGIEPFLLIKLGRVKS